MHRILSLAAAVTGLACLALVVVGAQGRGQPQVALPDGPGRDMVQATCSKCHALNLIADSWGNTDKGWHDLFSSMVTLPKDQADTIAAYLAKNFPSKPAPEAVVIAGPATVSFKEWLVPTLGSRPHDPLAAADGSLWWSGQFADRLGRLDPASGQMKEFPLPEAALGTARAGRGQLGAIWFTANSNTYIGKLDPKTGNVTEYPLPRGCTRPAHANLRPEGHTLLHAAVGTHRPADACDREIKVSKTPSDNTYPYGIQVNSKGIPWYVDFRGNRIGSVDPVSLAIKEYTLPSPDARPRRIAITQDDVVWYTDFARGYLGRFDPGDRQGDRVAVAWRARVAAVRHRGDARRDSGTASRSVRPNTLVRFDPRTEKFQTWIIPAGGGVVRNMMPTRDGNLAIAESGVNRVALVSIGGAGTQ